MNQNIKFNMKVMHLTVGFDQNFMLPFGAFAASVLKNNPQHTFAFHAIATGLTETDKTMFIDYVERHGSQLHFYEVPGDFAAGFTSHGFGRATFYRLLFSRLLPVEIKKFLYLDVDIIVTGDLAPLYNINMHGMPVAAVLDTNMALRPELGMPAGSLCFNAGVLMIDREKWVEQKISEKAVDFLNSNHKAAIYADQDALNATLVNNWLQIDSKYNLMKDYIPRDLQKKEINKFLEDKVIVHFAQFYKPWNTLCNNRLRDLYYEYLRTTPFSKEVGPADFKINFATISGLLKIKARELYYDYPIIPLKAVDIIRKKMR